MAPDRLRTRILIWVEEEVRVGALPPKSGAVLEAVLFRGNCRVAMLLQSWGPGSDRHRAR